jgi:hypothetical protein
MERCILWNEKVICGKRAASENRHVITDVMSFIDGVVEFYIPEYICLFQSAPASFNVFKLVNKDLSAD